MNDETENPEASGQNVTPSPEENESPKLSEPVSDAPEAAVELADPAKEPEEKTADVSKPDLSVERILGIVVPVTVSFGSSQKQLKEILQMAPGTVLELDKTADDPVLLKVNKKVFAKGQVVVVDGHYGIKITEVDSARERLASLGGDRS